MAFPQNDRIIINVSRTSIEKVKRNISNKLLSMGLKEIQKNFHSLNFNKEHYNVHILLQGDRIELPVNIIFYDADLPGNNQYKLKFPENQPLL